MQLSAGIQQFWIAIASYILLGLSFFLYLLAGNNWQLTNMLSLPDLMGFTLVVAIVIFPLLWYLSNLKCQILHSMPDDVQFQEIVPTNYSQLDIVSLAYYTTILESLGFIHLIDHDIKPGIGFARCFAHPEYYCFAEVGQAFTETGEVIAQNFALFSVLQQDWIVAEINRAINSHDGIAYIWRHPQHIRRYHPNIDIEELLQSHLQFRQQILADLGIHLSTDLSWTAFKAYEKQAIIFRKQAMRRKNLLMAMLEATLFELSPKSEWLGNYLKQAVKNPKNKFYQ
ncbi:MAG: hypothetical protein KAF91_05140 [Nostoc sp. TH1S01]|nr:hypothetical protein [Nostoc sp. TH1S01]